MTDDQDLLEKDDDKLDEVVSLLAELGVGEDELESVVDALLATGKQGGASLSGLEDGDEDLDSILSEHLPQEEEESAEIDIDGDSEPDLELRPEMTDKEAKALFADPAENAKSKEPPFTNDVIDQYQMEQDMYGNEAPNASIEDLVNQYYEGNEKHKPSPRKLKSIVQQIQHILDTDTKVSDEDTKEKTGKHNVNPKNEPGYDARLDTKDNRAERSKKKEEVPSDRRIKTTGNPLAKLISQLKY